MECLPDYSQQLFTVEGKVLKQLDQYPKLFGNSCCYNNILVLFCVVLLSLGPPPTSDSNTGKMRANTPLELWKKVFEKTFPPRVRVYTSAAQILFPQNSSNITTNCCFFSPLTGISVTFGSSVSSNLYNSYFFFKTQTCTQRWLGYWLLHLQSPSYFQE